MDRDQFSSSLSFFNEFKHNHKIVLFIGLDVHDVGGYLDHCPPRPTQKGLTSLRFARDLKAGMYVTIEPGCYFIKHVSKQLIIILLIQRKESISIFPFYVQNISYSMKRSNVKLRKSFWLLIRSSNSNTLEAFALKMMSLSLKMVARISP